VGQPELIAVEVAMIRLHQSNDPKAGYSRSPRASTRVSTFCYGDDEQKACGGGGATANEASNTETGAAPSRKGGKHYGDSTENDGSEDVGVPQEEDRLRIRVNSNNDADDADDHACDGKATWTGVCRRRRRAVLEVGVCFLSTPLCRWSSSLVVPRLAIPPAAIAARREIPARSCAAFSHESPKPHRGFSDYRLGEFPGAASNKTACIGGPTVPLDAGRGNRWVVTRAGVVRPRVGWSRRKCPSGKG